MVFATAVEAPAVAVVTGAAGAACPAAVVVGADAAVDFLDRECLAAEVAVSAEAEAEVAVAVAVVSVAFLDFFECFALAVPVSVDVAAAVAVDAVVSVAVDLCECFFFAVVLVESVDCGELNRAAAEAGSTTKPNTLSANGNNLIEHEEYLFFMNFPFSPSLAKYSRKSSPSVREHSDYRWVSSRVLILAAISTKTRAEGTATPCYSLGVNDRLAFIFDLDGVLVNSMPLHVIAWERYLERLGIQVEDLETRMHGRRNEELVYDLIASDLPADTVFAHGAAKEQLWRDLLIEDGIERYRIAGVTEFLERHVEVPKAIASNAEPQNIEFVLDHYGLKRFFDIAVNGLEVARPKPYPDVYLEAARRLHREPAECIVFEDSPTGLKAGIAAGMRVVGVETTSSDLDEAELRVKDFADPRLEDWLARELQSR